MRREIAWQDPLETFAAAAREDGDLVFLHSADAGKRRAGRSWLATAPAAGFDGSDWEGMRRFVEHHAGAGTRIFGQVGYEAARASIAYAATDPSPIDAPTIRLRAFASLASWDHATGACRLDGSRALPRPDESASRPVPAVDRLTSNLSRTEYLARVAATRDAIAEGDFYQANLTRKFFGRFASPPDAAELFARLCRLSPAPYAAYLRLGDTHLLSSSPESFLSVSDGVLRTRPIKGTRRRDPAESDADARAALERSGKDRAENLMIVDLMRNDLARCCLPGSIGVDRLFETDSYASLHHLSSTIEGRLAPGRGALDALRLTFPPGSMTGAPKIAAMRWCAEAERLDRGAYSGVVGWTSLSEAEWSVVIRTLIVRGDRFEFQVGGGIVADSDPEAEWRETLVKAAGLLAALGLPETAIAAL